MLGKYNHREIHKQLPRRSVSAIKLKQHRSGWHFLDNVYTLSTLSRELGRNRCIIRKWYRRGWLKGRPATWRSYFGKVPTLFEEDDIVTFLRAHPLILKPEEISHPYFAHIVREARKGEQNA